MDHTQTSLAGEFYVLAQLMQRGLVATLTLANTKGVDILVSNPELNRLFKIEVKTTVGEPRHGGIFADERCHTWPMSAKHEPRVSEDLFYVFVVLRGCTELPRFFVVPSGYVAAYVREQHAYWLRTRQTPGKPTTMRLFRIPASDPLGFEDTWGVLAGEPVPEHHQVPADPWYAATRSLS